MLSAGKPLLDIWGAAFPGTGAAFPGTEAAFPETRLYKVVLRKKKARVPPPYKVRPELHLSLRIIISEAPDGN